MPGLSVRAPSFALTLLVAAAILPLCLSPEGRAQSETEPITWGEALDQAPDWYRSSKAIRIADNVLLYQHESGGWPKNIDMAEVLSEEDEARIRKEQAGGGTTLSNITIDNGATYTQMHYLARVYETTGRERFKEGFLRGIDYLLEAQYDNGGWPQYYPIREGYYERITFNDEAMIGVMRLLRIVAERNAPYDFVGEKRRAKITTALNRGLEVILETQIEVDGKLTAWCAQYDEQDLSPAGARSYEPPSISGAESVGIVEYLMELEDPSPEVIRAVEAAVEWFERVKLTDIRLIEVEDPSLPEGYDLVVGLDPTNSSPLWARFYEMGTNYPMFVDRDGNVHDALHQIPYERRVGYAWLRSWAQELLEERYPTWRKKHRSE